MVNLLAKYDFKIYNTVLFNWTVCKIDFSLNLRSHNLVYVITGYQMSRSV